MDPGGPGAGGDGLRLLLAVGRAACDGLCRADEPRREALGPGPRDPERGRGLGPGVDRADPGAACAGGGEPRHPGDGRGAGFAGGPRAGGPAGDLGGWPRRSAGGVPAGRRSGDDVAVEGAGIGGGGGSARGEAGGERARGLGRRRFRLERGGGGLDEPRGMDAPRPHPGAHGRFRCADERRGASRAPHAPDVLGRPGGRRIRGGGPHAAGHGGGGPALGGLRAGGVARAGRRLSGCVPPPPDLLGRGGRAEGGRSGKPAGRVGRVRPGGGRADAGAADLHGGRGAVGAPGGGGRASAGGRRRADAGMRLEDAFGLVPPDPRAGAARGLAGGDLGAIRAGERVAHGPDGAAVLGGASGAPAPAVGGRRIGAHPQDPPRGGRRRLAGAVGERPAAVRGAGGCPPLRRRGVRRRGCDGVLPARRDAAGPSGGGCGGAGVRGVVAGFRARTGGAGAPGGGGPGRPPVRMARRRRGAGEDRGGVRPGLGGCGMDVARRGGPLCAPDRPARRRRGPACAGGVDDGRAQAGGGRRRRGAGFDPGARGGAAAGRAGVGGAGVDRTRGRRRADERMGAGGVPRGWLAGLQRRAGGAPRFAGTVRVHGHGIPSLHPGCEVPSRALSGAEARAGLSAGLARRTGKDRMALAGGGALSAGRTLAHLGRAAGKSAAGPSVCRSLLGAAGMEGGAPGRLPPRAGCGCRLGRRAISPAEVLRAPLLARAHGQDGGVVDPRVHRRGSARRRLGGLAVLAVRGNRPGGAP